MLIFLIDLTGTGGWASPVGTPQARTPALKLQEHNDLWRTNVTLFLILSFEAKFRENFIESTQSFVYILKQWDLEISSFSNYVG